MASLTGHFLSPPPGWEQSILRFLPPPTPSPKLRGQSCGSMGSQRCARQTTARLPTPRGESPVSPAAGRVRWRGYGGTGRLGRRGWLGRSPRLRVPGISLWFILYVLVFYTVNLCSEVPPGTLLGERIKNS